MRTPPVTPVEVDGIRRRKSRIPDLDEIVYLPGTDTPIVPSHHSGYYGCTQQRGGAGVVGSGVPRHVLWTEAVIEDMMSDLSMPIAQVRRLVWAFGRACQKRLVLGRSCGIPFVGELRIVSYRRDERRIARLRRIAEQRCFKDHGHKPDYQQRLKLHLASYDAEYRKGRNHQVVTLYQGNSLFQFYRDHVNQAAADENTLEWARLKERYRTLHKRKELNPYRLMSKKEYAHVTGSAYVHPSGRKYRITETPSRDAGRGPERSSASDVGG